MAGEPRRLERLKFWSGQLLASGDFRTLVAVNGALRAAHNRAVHRAYGVAIGLDVADPADGSVLVECGLAYDCHGAEIVVPTTAEVPLPADGTRTLIVVSRHAAGTAAFTWMRPQQFSWKHGVALRDLADVSFAVAGTRPLAQPKIATGKTVPGGTSWQKWETTLDGDTVEIGVQTRVDTSAAGFTSTPHYFPTVRSESPEALSTWFTSVADELPGSFTTRLFFRRITRQRLKVAAPLTFVVKVPETLVSAALKDAAALVASDRATRLAPIAGERRVVKDKDSDNDAVTLLDPLVITGTVPVAFGTGPRAQKVENVERKSAMDLTFAAATPFAAEDIAVRLGASAPNWPPAIVHAQLGDGTVELRTPMVGLAPGDVVGKAEFASLVEDVDGVNVRLARITDIRVGEVVTRFDEDADQSLPAIVRSVNGVLLELGTPIPGLVAQGSLGVVRGSFVVSTPTPVADLNRKVQFADEHAFVENDLVTPVTAPGALAVPVRVHTAASKSLQLEQPLPGLDKGDRLAAAGFAERATVLGVLDRRVLLGDATGFTRNCFVARVKDVHADSPPARVLSASGNTIELDAAIKGLTRGQVLGVVAPARLAKVVAVADDGRIVDVDMRGAFDPLDAVGVPAKTKLALATPLTPTRLRLSEPIGLVAGEELARMYVRGVTEATRDGSDTRLKVDRIKAIESGDFVAPVAGWRDVGLARTVQVITGDTVTLSDPASGTLAGFSGALPHDAVGLVSLTPSSLRLRVEEVAKVLPGDEVLVSGADRTSGRTVIRVATVDQVLLDGKVILLKLRDPGDAFAIQPGELDVSVLLVRGEPVKFANQLGLYVTWIACEERDARPPECEDPPVVDPCEATEVEVKRCC